MRPDLCQRSTWVALLFALLVCAQMAEAAEATCRATRIGPGARVSIVLDELLDPDLYRLVRLGMRGRITLELKVVRRGFLFGRTLSRTEVQTSLIWSEGREALFLDGREVRDPRKLELERISVDADAPDDAEVEVQAKARLQVVTAQSLGDVARWLGRGRDSNSGLSGNVISAVADDLTRSVETVCVVRPREPGAQAVTFDAAPAAVQKVVPVSGTSTSPGATSSTPR